MEFSFGVGWAGHVAVVFCLLPPNLPFACHAVCRLT